MRILFVNEIFGYLGGIEQNIAHAARALGDRGHECYLAFGEAKGRSLSDFRACFRRCFPCTDLAERPEPGSLSFEPIVEQLSPDLVFYHDVSVLPHVSSKTTTPSVMMVHDHEMCCPRQCKLYAWNHRVCRRPAGWICYLDLAFLERRGKGLAGIHLRDLTRHFGEMERRRASIDHFLVASRFMREELLMNRFPEERVAMIPLGAPVERPAPSPAPEENRILCTGRLIHAKGVDLLLQAVRHLEVPVQVDIVGTGDARRKLERMTDRLGLSDRVRFHGWKGHQQLRDFYDAAKVVALPSRRPEPFGLAGIEAMHHGRPVVAFNVGGIPDWLEDEKTGLLAPEANVKELARALQRVLSDTELAREMGRNAHERACEHYSLEKYADQLEDFLLKSAPKTEVA